MAGLGTPACFVTAGAQMDNYNLPVCVFDGVVVRFVTSSKVEVDAQLVILKELKRNTLKKLIPWFLRWMIALPERAWSPPRF